MSFWDNIDWVDAVSAIGDFFSSKDKKDKELNYGELYRLINPNVSTPFYNTTSEWDAATKSGSQRHELTPETQAMFNEIIEQLAAPKAPRSMSRSMDELQNANLNAQRGRYELDPLPFEYTDPQMTGGYDPRGGGYTGGDYGGQEQRPSDIREGGVSDVGRIISLLTGQGRGRVGQGDIGGGLADGYGGGTVNERGNWSPSDIGGRMTDQHGNNMYNPVVGYNRGGSAGSWIADNAEMLGRAFSAATGLPFGGTAGRNFTDWVYDNYTFMNPVDPNNPYGLGNSPINMNPNNPSNLPSSGIPPSESSYSGWGGSGLLRPARRRPRGGKPWETDPLIDTH